MSVNDMHGAMASVVEKFSALHAYLLACKPESPCWPQFADRIAAAAKAGGALPLSLPADRVFVHDVNNLLGAAMLNADEIEMRPDLADFQSRFGGGIARHIDAISSAIARVSRMLKPLNILIIDDNADFAEVLSMGIEARKHTCDIFCAITRDALLSIKTADAVFLDCSLPGSSLEDVIAQVGDYGGKIMLISGAELYMLPYVEKLVNKNEVAGFLKKPFAARDIEHHARSIFLSSLTIND